jgi:GNAT superfamily N-acetyltransferase
LNSSTRSTPAAGFDLRSLAKDQILRPMEEADIGQAVSLISRVMNPDEGGYAAQAMHLHFSCRRQGINDGRIFYVLSYGPRILGIVGLHHYAWGPPENVWLSWFALDPELQGQGIASRLLDAVIAEAKRHNFMKFFIETYDSPEFARARAFYRAQGFQEAASIPHWLPGGGAMVVFYREIAPHE